MSKINFSYEIETLFLIIYEYVVLLTRTRLNHRTVILSVLSLDLMVALRVDLLNQTPSGTGNTNSENNITENKQAPLTKVTRQAVISLEILPQSLAVLIVTGKRAVQIALERIEILLIPLNQNHSIGMEMKGKRRREVKCLISILVS